MDDYKNETTATAAPADPEEQADIIDDTQTPKEIALANKLNETCNELSRVKEQLRKLQISNEELTLKVGIQNENTDEIFKQFSKYNKER